MDWFCGSEIPFKWIYSMTLHATWIELDLDLIELNSNY